MEEKKKYFSRKEIADILSVSHETIRKYYTDYGLPIAFRVGGQPRFDLEEVLEWFKNRNKKESK